MTKVVVVFALLIVSFYSTQAQAVETFRAELEEYALNHTRQELEAYAHGRIHQMTYEAWQPAFFLNGVLLSDSLIDQLEDDAINSIAPQLPGLRELWNSCRYAHTSDLLTSTTIASEAIAGCSSITSLSDSLFCSSDALAAHAALIAAARTRRIACWEGALAGCRTG